MKTTLRICLVYLVSIITAVVAVKWLKLDNYLLGLFILISPGIMISQVRRNSLKDNDVFEHYTNLALLSLSSLIFMVCGWCVNFVPLLVAIMLIWSFMLAIICNAYSAYKWALICIVVAHVATNQVIVIDATIMMWIFILKVHYDIIK